MSKSEYREVYEYMKDGFRHGEYSIYLRSYRNGTVSSETYCFGVSKKYEAIAACEFLNELLERGGK